MPYSYEPCAWVGAGRRVSRGWWVVGDDTVVMVGVFLQNATIFYQLTMDVRRLLFMVRTLLRC